MTLWCLRSVEETLVSCLHQPAHMHNHANLASVYVFNNQLEGLVIRLWVQIFLQGTSPILGKLLQYLGTDYNKIGELEFHLNPPTEHGT